MKRILNLRNKTMKEAGGKERFATAKYGDTHQPPS